MHRVDGWNPGESSFKVENQNWNENIKHESGSTFSQDGLDVDAPRNSSHLDGTDDDVSRNSSHQDGPDDDVLRNSSLSYLDGTDDDVSLNSSHQDGIDVDAPRNSSHLDDTDDDVSRNSSHQSGTDDDVSRSSSHEDDCDDREEETGGRSWQRTPRKQQKRTSPNKRGGVGRQQQQENCGIEKEAVNTGKKIDKLTV